MCQPKGSQNTSGVRGCNCGCGPLFRRFITAREEEERLGEYKELQKEELEGLEERIHKLKDK